MKWLVDECVLASIVKELRDAGHDVLFAAEHLQQREDIDLADIALKEDRILLTDDKDFSDIVFHARRDVPGFVLMRIPPDDRHLKWPKLREAIDRFGNDLHGRHMVISKARIRLRPLR